MKKFLAAASALALVSGPAQAADAAAALHVFKPSGAWTADFGEDYCRLSRNFTDGTEEISLAVERVQPGNFARIVMVGDGMKLYRRATTIGYRFMPSGNDRQGPLLRSDTAEGKQYLNLDLVMFAPPAPPPAPGAAFPIYNRAAEQDFAKGINGIVFTDGLLEPVQFDTGSLKSPIEAMQLCADDLLAYWGLDAARHAAMTKIAWPSNDSTKWLPARAIPFQDFQKLGGGANQIRVMVSADGKPTDCKIQGATLDAGTNAVICKAIMEKGAFAPALDAEGKPMASYWMTSAFGLMPPFGGT
jgi:hypothetical protein